ncbi:MAG TPA: hypothetical protein VFI62_03600, partial [Burkholderiales bacterium]|nr:hypothetical protein [Burkholderiales bacterium]
MLIRNAQLLLFSTLLAGAVQAYASPVLYAWAGNSVGATGGSTYVIDPVAGTVIQLRGAGDGIGSSSGASGGTTGSGEGTGRNPGANSSGGSMGAVNSGGGVSPGTVFAASSRAR